MKIYVAGKFEDQKRVKNIQEQLISRGHEITKDWTEDKEAENGFPVINVVEDMRGIATADAYVGVFVDKFNYKGALVELGAAIALRKKVYVIGHGADSCIFLSHPLVRRCNSVKEIP